ncbi:class I SAM-dependent methyltransferase [Microbacterium sp. NPDC090003]|uniref:class I SAM-dependent methyltransferase n=1 Tax=Microbacterium sp. NPDC090003 TaxID=3364203 RepID=UPI00381789FF
MVDRTLADSFQTIGVEYDRYRPGFPDAAADLILPEQVGTALDLAAGTGKFTELLVGRATYVQAVEPSEPMLDVLRAKLVDVAAHLGTAESIPLSDASVDAVTVAQAFHWFEPEAACAEIARVLAPGGVLGLVWNHSDPTCAWDRAAHRIAHPAVGENDQTTGSAAEDLPGFEFDSRAVVAWSEEITRDDYLRRWGTVSSLLVADGRTKAAMLAAIDRVLDEDPDTSGQTELELPQLTEVYRYRRIA